MLKKYKNKTAIQNRDVGRGALSEKNRELIINWKTIVSKLPMLDYTVPIPLCVCLQIYE